MNQEQLLKQFITVAAQVETTVELIEKSAKSLEQALLKAVSEKGDIVLAEMDDLDAGLFESFRKNERVLKNPADQHLAAAKYGITDGFAAVARTGSVCVSMTEKMGGSFSLFVGNHIAVVDVNMLVARPRDVFSKSPLKEKALSRDFVFVSGSSATADMGPLVRGVHGPGKLHIIFLK